MEELKRKETETREQYIYRMYSNKVQFNMTNKEVADVINQELETNYQESYLRGIYKNYEIGYTDALESLKGNKECNNMIDEIVDAIGELDVKKIEVRNKTNKLNKIKRDLVKNVEITNAINEYIDREVENFTRLDYERIVNISDKKLIVGLADFHIGYVIKGFKGNYYNYEIAKLRLSKLLSEIKKEIDRNDITQVIVANAGDTTEHTYMSQNQSYDCEFDSNEQIVMAEELLYNFITSISEMKVNVDVYSVGGNHQRGNGNKDANIEGDNNNLVIVRNLRRWFESAKNKRVVIHEIDYKEDCVVFEVNGKRIKLKHGDTSPRESKKFYDTEVSMNDCSYDMIIKGHDHNFNVTTQNNGNYVLTIGCLFGYNPYSVKKVQCTTHASQILIVVGDNEFDYIRDINLQIV
jgi:predicted phosphodiesterase